MSEAAVLETTETKEEPTTPEEAVRQVQEEAAEEAAKKPPIDPYGLLAKEEPEYVEGVDDVLDGPEKKAEGKTEVAVEEVPADLIERGKTLGLTETQVKAYGGAAKVALQAIEEAIFARAGQDTTDPSEDAPVRKERKSEATKVSEEVRATVEAPNFDELLKELAEDTFDPRMKEAIKAVGGKLKEYVDAHLAKVDGEFGKVADAYTYLSQGQQHLAQQRMAADMDRYYDGLPGEWRDVFGQGDDLTEEQMQARVKVADHADRMALGYEKSKLAVPKTRQLLDMAKRAVYGEKVAAQSKQQVTKQIEQKIAERRSGAVQKPSQRRESRGELGKLSPEQAAEEAVRQWKRDHPEHFQD